MIDLYFLKVSASGLTVLVHLNGVPVVVDQDGFGIEQTLPVNQWLRPDQNTLSITLDLPSPDPDDEDAEEIGDMPQTAQVSLFLHQQGASSPTPAVTLAQFDWPIAGQRPAYPHTWSQPLEGPVNVPPGMTLWNRTKPVSSVDAQARNAIYGLATTVAKLLREQRLDEAFQYLSLRYRDEAIAEGKPPEQIKTAVIEMWQVMVGIPDIGLAEMPIDAFEFNLVGDQHVVEMVRKDGMPAILFEDEEDETIYGIPLYFSVVDNQWVIIR